ncbi:MAG TPA: class II aldolase/adducin family protein [Candidatus Limnocylindrales bacterium]|nr:class II aldolase/adducin family protein [Candidatus Limnocylindrales bacterium]
MSVEAPPGLLEAVAGLSRRFGSDPGFTRGGGGNTSAKAGGVLWIKPSGVSLAALTADALMPLAMEPLLAMLAPDAPPEPPGSDPVLRVGMAARLDAGDQRRPSVEALFHALLPDPIVVHTHPTLVNAVTCAQRGADVARELFGDEVLWIPYTDPGLPLARRIAAEREVIAARTGRPAPSVLLLGNHGLVVTGATAADVVERTERVIGALRERVGSLEPALEPRDAPQVPELLAGAGVVADASPVARWIATTGDGHAFVRGGPLTPDQIVYCGSWPMLVEAPVALDAASLPVAVERHASATGQPPSLYVVDGQGVIATGPNAALTATALDTYLDAARIAIGAGGLGGARPLTAEERRFIEDWEAEAYRKGIAGTPTVSA